MNIEFLSVFLVIDIIIGANSGGGDAFSQLDAVQICLGSGEVANIDLGKALIVTDYNVNEADLATALSKGSIAGAALDVVSTEPIGEDNPLLSLANCVITPHMAWASLEARQRLMQTTADNIARFQSGTPINVVNE